MKISIIVPVYNVKEYVSRCFDSILNSVSGVDDYEVVVVDDGSTDGSEQIVDEYCDNHAHFIGIHKKNAGLVAAWIDGVRKSTGDYIGFVDSDDFVSDSMFKVLYDKAVEYNADIIMVNHYYDRRSVNGTLEIHRNPIRGGYYAGADLEKIRPLVFPEIGKDYVSPARWNKLLKRELLVGNVKYSDTQISSGEDVNIMVPCLLNCQSLYYVDEPHYYYEYRGSSISNVFKENLLDSYIILVTNLSTALEDANYKDKDEKFRLWNFYGYLWTCYVQKADMPLRFKSEQIHRLSQQEEFTKATIVCGKDYNSFIYKLTVRSGIGLLPLAFNSTKKLARKILRK